MILKCFDGPMDGAVYVLSRLTAEPSERSTTRKPDGLWFAGQDEHGRNVQHQYANDRLAEDGGSHVVLCYRYTGPVVETGIEMETSEKPNWRVGLRVTPKHAGHHLFGSEGTVEAIHGDFIHVRMFDPEPAVYEEPADEWMTA